MLPAAVISNKTSSRSKVGSSAFVTRFCSAFHVQMSRPSSLRTSRSGMVDVLLDKLEQATDTFALEQEICLEQFRAQMEKLLVEQQRFFEQNSEVRLAVREPPNDNVETAYMFDSQARSLTLTEDSHLLVAESTDVPHMNRGGESGLLVDGRLSEMPCPMRIDTVRSDVYFEQ